MEWEKQQIIMGKVIFIVGGKLHLPWGNYIFEVGKAANYYGQGDFYYGKSTSPSLGKLHFWGVKSSRLLWAGRFLLWEVNFTFPGEISFLRWEKQQVVMGREIFIMGGQLHLPWGNCISEVGKAADYYGQGDFYYGRSTSPSMETLHL